MERPFPPSSQSIPPIPGHEPPIILSYSIKFLFFLSFLYFIVSLTFILGKFMCNRLFQGSQQVQVPDNTPTDTTTGIDASEIIEWNHVIIYVDDSSSSPSSSDTQVMPSELGSCPICLEELAEGEGLRLLRRCMHVYHQPCIDQWMIRGSQICPLCRERVMLRIVRKIS